MAARDQWETVSHCYVGMETPAGMMKTCQNQMEGIERHHSKWTVKICSLKWLDLLHTSN